MKEIKDLFSKQAATYAAFRPTYPAELFEWIFKSVHRFDDAWDCGTGNGQVANRLAERFNHVYATDISQQQLDNAVGNNKITYAVARAEKITYPDNSFDLVTVGTAIHWFDFDAFYKEVNRVLKNEGVLAVWCYSLLNINGLIDNTLSRFHTEIVGKYWDKERKYVDEKYQTIPFPFEEIPVPELYIKTNWSLEQLVGYLNSWSAVQHYINKEGTNPVDIILPELRKNWADGEIKEMTFPLSMRMGRIYK